MRGKSPITDDQLLAYFEGALPSVEARELAARLDGDETALARLAEWDRQNAMIRALYDPVAEEPVPARLTDALNSAPGRTGFLLRRIAAAFALLALGAAGGWLASDLRFARVDALADAAIGAHVTYASEVRHPVEVEAAQADHLVAWLSKRLGHDIAAPDFASEGFRLMGGRLLPGRTGPAALFMYENTSGQRISLYVAPSNGGETAFQFSEEGDVKSFWWLDGALSYAVVGNVGREVLRRIALDAYDQLV